MNSERQRDGQEVAAQNEFKTLYWLHRFRWLTSNQLSRLIWPSDARQAQRMAQRTLRRLTSAGKVLARRLHTGGIAYVLTERGAYLLREHGIEARLRGERDARLAAPYHRAVANEIAIHGILRGWEVWTENEVQRNKGPIREIKKHVPDVLFRRAEEHPSLSWCEIENTPKSRTKLRGLLELAEALVGRDDGYPVGDDWLDHFVLVAPNLASAKSVARAILAAQTDKVIGYNALQRIEMWICDMSRQLAWQGDVRAYTALEIVHQLTD